MGAARQPEPLGMPLQSALVADPQLRINAAANQPDAKARELATYFVGQVVGSLDKVQPARSVVLDMVSEFIDAVERLERLVER
ncbi:nitronate monooxygenase family protein [Mycobacterium xenopi 3993]|nr:nitronate monooxygenase family protein [Mycobacterium xenopi 3993]